MKNYKNDDLKIFINTLVSHGYLDMVESIGRNNSFATIRVNNMSKEIIKGNKKVMLYEIISEENKKEINHLYDKLKELRFNIAKNNNIAPYMIFSDASLMEMSKNYPTTKEEMLSISGMGEVKFNKYGSEFIDIIEKYMLENHIYKENVCDKNQNEDEEFLYIETNKELYERLKELTAHYAKKENTIFYKILSKNTLKEISARYPKCEKELLDIGGIGAVKVNKYGTDIIKIVNEYLDEKNMKPIWKDKKKLKLVIDGENRKNNEIALDLLNQGENIEDVSLKVEVAPATLLTYVNDYIVEGNVLNFELDLSKYYDKNEREIISHAIDETKSQNLNLIKRILPPTYKYRV